MPRQLDFFLYIGSTYTYLAVNRVEEIAARERISLRWRPFNARAIMLEQNNRPFIGKPVKLNYMWRDVERRANRYAIPFKSIPTYPVDPEELANRVAVVASLEGWCPEYTKATYRTCFLKTRPREMLSTYGFCCRTLGRTLIRRSHAPTAKKFEIDTLPKPKSRRNWVSLARPRSCGTPSSSGATTDSKTPLSGLSPMQIEHMRRPNPALNRTGDTCLIACPHRRGPPVSLIR